MKLFLAYVAANCRRPITRLQLADLSAQRVRDSSTQGGQRGIVWTTQSGLAALHTFYRFLALDSRNAGEAQQVEATPVKRTAPPQTLY